MLHTFAKLFSVTFILTAAGAVFTTRATPAVPQAISTVMVEVIDASTHGSGVYIGRGTVITAAHVVGKNTAMTVVDSLGHKQPATVVRLNKDTDVALLHIVSAPMASTPLDPIYIVDTTKVVCKYTGKALNYEHVQGK